MKNFSELGIKSQAKGFEGEKIKTERILNKEVIVEDYKIVTSKFTDKGSGKCLHLQILVDGNKRVWFTGSFNLMEVIERVPKEAFPFKTIIAKENERFEFT